MVENTIRMVSQNVSFRAVHASRGKVIRAEPASALYEQRKVHHVGTFAALEDQMCAFTTDFNRMQAGFSPDRVDALVWALTELLGEAEPPQPVFGTYGRDVSSYCGEPDHSAGSVYASRPPEFWAARGVFHKNDEAYWVAKGVWKPPPEGPTK